MILKDKILRALTDNNETPADVVAHNLDANDLTARLDDPRNCFDQLLIWTTNFVYYWEHDRDAGEDYILSVPRNPQTKYLGKTL